MWITGAAVITPLGDLEATVRGLSGPTPIRAGVPHAGTSAAQIADAPQRGRAAFFLQRAAAAAMAQAGVSGALPAFVGTCSGAMDEFEAWREGAVPPWYAAPAGALAGPTRTFSSACTSSLAALHAAVRLAGDGPILVAGTDGLCEFTTSGFAALRATSPEPCRPFSKSRRGLSFGEGAAVLVLESERSAEKRGAQRLGEVLGVGLSSDASHRTAPRADAAGLERAVRKACADPRSVDVYVSHGTGTQASDASELVLGARIGLLGKPWLAHKAFIGHAMGASGLISLVLALEQMREGATFAVPYDDLEAGVAMSGSVAGARTALIVAAAFGGSNAAAQVSL